MDRKRALTSETLTRVFSDLDDDHDGELGPRVFASALQECHIDVKEDQLTKLMVAEGFVHGAEVIMRAETFKRCLLHVSSLPCMPMPSPSTLSLAHVCLTVLVSCLQPSAP